MEKIHLQLAFKQNQSFETALEWHRSGGPVTLLLRQKELQKIFNVVIQSCT